MPRRIDDVDSIILPVDRRGSRGNRNTPALLLRHPVQRRGSGIDLSNTVLLVGIIEHPFRNSRLARINMGNDSYVSHRPLGHKDLRADEEKG